MRIVLDLQGAQTLGSRHRGIGRYTLSLAQAIARQAGEHEIILALNGLFPETIESIRGVFDGLVSQLNIRVWQAPGPVKELDPGNTWRRQSAERVREAFLASLRPDVVLVSSLFEGLGDDAVTSIGAFTNTVPTAVTLYDLIPLIYREKYLQNPTIVSWYERKLGHMRRAKLWLAISESSRREGIDYLGLPEEWVFNISSAADEFFHPLELPNAKVEDICRRYGLSKPFVMYTGGIDYRKNIEGLIRAYAKLPEDIKREHLLAIVCSIQPGDRERLERLASSQGLAAGQVIFTGFVPDEDLLALYNLCRVFVFPSWHEGFGLPALEAMSCGTAVIGANTSSLPEVIGREDALFDPFNEADIAAKLAEVLKDEAFREELQRHGLKQAKNFSWEHSANRALEAFDRLHRERLKIDKVQVQCTRPCRARLAYVSPLPPEKSGIADYSAELLPELARHYEIEVIVNQQEVTDPWVNANCHVRSVEWFKSNASNYERILYHFGNSALHQHMFYLLERYPGVVMLHDFFLSSVVAHMDVYGFCPQFWTQALYLSHGYTAVRERFQSVNMEDVIWKFPCNFAVLQQALGVIVHSDFSRRLADQWYKPDIALNWCIIPLLRVPVQAPSRSVARKKLGLSESDFVICSFGLLGPTKLNHRLLAAWLVTSMAKDANCHLVFVGENHGGDYGVELQDAIRTSGCAKRIRITGFVPRDQYRLYLAAADVAVQLRTLSRGETSAAVLDCMNYGLPTVVNAHGSLAELPEDCVIMLPDDFTDDQLAKALETLWSDPGLRQTLGERARAHIRTRHKPRKMADQYARAIETCYNSPAGVRNRLMQSLATLEGSPGDESSWLDLARSVAGTLPLTQPQRQLLVDVSELVKYDAKSGIQRVVRSVLKELLEHPPAGFRVEPIYATADFSYRYARGFTLNLLNCPGDAFSDEPIDLYPGDIFLGLDLQPQVILQQRGFLERARNWGVGVFFVVYDLLPILIPDCFPPEVFELYKQWLSVVAQGDGALCISRSVAVEFVSWMDESQPQRHRPFKIGWFHLGANIDASLPTTGLPDEFEEQLCRLRARPSVLMVGTVEPRKGHAQALAAFEQLWGQGVEVNLVIVGKQGWMVEELVECLNTHPELNKRLYWYQGISDEALLKLYEIVTGVLVSSRGESFGLPLIEAARHGCPVLARDIPVFREVAGNYASYFSGNSPESLAEALKKWLDGLQAGTAPVSSRDMPWRTWAECARQIIGLLTDSDHPNWLYRWLPKND